MNHCLLMVYVPGTKESNTRRETYKTIGIECEQQESQSESSTYPSQEVRLPLHSELAFCDLSMLAIEHHAPRPRI